MVVETNPRFSVIGTRPIRHDGVDKVTGRARYGADVTLPGTLYARVLRSPFAHARIRSIDTSKAEALPGVRAVITGRDMPRPSATPVNYGEGPHNMRRISENLLADRKVLYRGHAVAAVAANSVHLAEEALSLIELEYEPLPPVLDVRDAMREDAPLLHEDLITTELGTPIPGARPSNVASHVQFVKGDPEAGFAEADTVVEHEFSTQMVHQGYIEPQACSAFWNRDDQLTVYTTTQGGFAARGQLAALLGLPASKIKVVPTEIGGGFGGKIPVYVEPLAALLSKKTGRPVKLQLSRAEVFEATGPTSGTFIRVKLGIRRDGTLTAGEALFAFEAGAYPGSTVGAACRCAFAAYDLPHARVDGYDVVVNKPKVAAYRAPGSPQAAFAVEQIMDEFAERLGIDPLQIRLQNASTEGSELVTGTVLTSVGNRECLEAALGSPHYQTPLEGPNRGRGIGHGYWMNVGMKSSVSVSMNEDGTVNLVEGNPDIGGTRPAIAMQLAETLGIAAEEVKPQVVDTDSVGYSDQTGGSRTAFATGFAAYEAGRDLIAQIRERVAKLWGADVDSVRYEQGVLTTANTPTQRMTFKEFAAQMLQTGPAIEGRGAVLPAAVGGSFATQLCDVEVDPETGKVTILRYTAVQDAGRAVHPAYVEGQMQGGASQGIGYALNEDYFYDESGRMQNASFLDYRVPTALDLPMIETIIVEVPFPGHPFGVRGVGEVGIVPPLAAVANAVYHATGVRFRNLPITPVRILEALPEQR